MALKTAGTVTSNRRARRDYDILESVEAGLVLTGAEIKSIREGRANINQAYAQEKKGELWLLNAHVSEFHGSNRFVEHDPLRPKKLLLHRKQIRNIARHASEQRVTLIPLRLYIKDHVAKVELAVARGRRKYDKRAVIAAKEADRQMRRVQKYQRR